MNKVTNLNELYNEYSKLVRQTKSRNKCSYKNVFSMEDCSAIFNGLLGEENNPIINFNILEEPYFDQITIKDFDKMGMIMKNHPTRYIKLTLAFSVRKMADDGYYELNVYNGLGDEESENVISGSSNIDFIPMEEIEREAQEKGVSLAEMKKMYMTSRPFRFTKRKIYLEEFSGMPIDEFMVMFNSFYKGDLKEYYQSQKKATSR